MDDDMMEALDPSPDISALFVHFNELYFDSALGACSVEWSSNRMTLCAGVCEYQKWGGCRIKLSGPLLQLRPRRDLLTTLLHEMIHARMFLEGIRDRDDHGPKFQEMMQLINSSVLPDAQRPVEGYNITVYHTFNNEVDLYRRHHWECDRCGHLVKRAMNRPPQEADCRGRAGRGSACQDTCCAYHMHIKRCGGTFVKIRSPKDTDAPRRKGATSISAAGSPSASKRPRLETTPLTGVRPINSYFSTCRAGKSGPALRGSATTSSKHMADIKPGMGQHTANGACSGQAGVQRADSASRSAFTAGGRVKAAEWHLDPSPLRELLADWSDATTGAASGSCQEALQAMPVSGVYVAGYGLAGSTGRVPECNAEELRQQCRNAALSRVGGNGSGSAAFSVQNATGSQAGLGDSSAGCTTEAGTCGTSSSSAGCHSTLGRLADSSTMVAPHTAAAARRAKSQALDHDCIVVSSDDDQDALGEGYGGGMNSSSELLTCPVCCAQWLANSITNVELNAHVTACLCV